MPFEITGTWTPDALRWISDLWPQAANQMMDGAVTRGASVVRRLWEYTLRRAPRFQGDMASAWQLTNEWRQGLDCIWEIESLRSEDPADSLDPGTSPFNVAWGKQDGIREHLAWVAVPSGAAVSTAGRVRRKLAAWAATHVNPAYGAAASGGAADDILRELRAAGVPPFLNVHSEAYEWAFNDVVTDLFGERYLADAVFDAIAAEWEA